MTKNKWSKEKIISAILDFKKNKKKLNSNHVQINHNLLYAAALRYFGSWEKAIGASGLNYSNVRIKRPFRKWSKKMILEEIQNRKKQGMKIHTMAVIAQDDGLYSAAKRYFKNRSWRGVIKLAGFDPIEESPKRIWTRDKLIHEIKERHAKKLPLYSYYLTKNKMAGMVGAAVFFFKSWKGAIEAAGLDYEEIRAVRHYWWTKQKILSQIKELEEKGERLSSKETHRKHADLFGAAIAHFGSWSSAVYATGIDYKIHCKTFSYKAWLRSLRNDQIKGLEKRIENFIRKGG